MMKRLAALLILANTVALISAGQNMHREARDIKGFTKISYAVPGNLEIKIGPEYNVILEGDDDDIEEIVTDISGDRLSIRYDRWNFSFNEKVNVYITMPEVNGISVSGSGKAQILDPVRNVDEMNFNLSGSGRLVTNAMEVDDLVCNISGSGSIIIGSEGKADRGEVTISGSGSYKGEDFEIDHLEVSVSGSGSCYCKVGDSLEAGISGSGIVSYKGDPKIDARVSGSGRVRASE